METSILTTKDTALLLHISKKSLYNLMHARAIPYYKPNGKNAYFKREDVEAYIFRGRVSTAQEITAQARAILAR